MKRRSFIRHGLAMAAGAPLTALAGRVVADDSTWDYVIVGAGTAGLPAAIHASRRGARVLLLDAAKDIGGTLHLAMGQISAAGSRLQDELGIVDSPDVHFEDVMRITRGLADPDIVRLTVDQAPDTINWLLDNGLVPLPGHPVTGAAPGQPGYSVRRYLWGANEGRDILRVLREQFTLEAGEGRITTLLSTRATGLLLNDAGVVEGVRANGADGDLAFRGRHVLLTSGGYAMNKEMFEQLVGFPSYMAVSYPHSQGDGLELAVSAGGWLRGQNLHRAGTGNILTSEEYPARPHGRFNTAPQERPPWEIWVNVRGERFVREDEPSVYERAEKLLDQPRLRYSIVFDQAILEQAPPGFLDWSREEFLAEFNSHPMFHRGDSLPELAKRAGVEADQLLKTVAAYNAAVQAGRDGFGREHLPLAIRKPPFYAITHLGSSATSSTGVVVDSSLRVMRGDGEPVPNLYAAGEVLGSGVTLGKAFTPGMLLTPALSLGRWLGMRLPMA